MGLKSKAEKIYEDLYMKIRAYSARKRRIKQFKKMSKKDSLSREQIVQIKEFYKPYYKPSMVFHRYFTEKRGEFCVNYLPQDIYVSFVDPYMNDIVAAKHMDNKCYYEQLFYKAEQPYIVIKKVNNILLNHDGKVVDYDEAMKLLAAEEDDLFVKEAQGTAGGSGVVCVEKSEKQAEDVMKTLKKVKTDVVVQRRIKQHKNLAVLNESSVNSLRIYSVLGSDGKATVYSPVLRMGVGAKRVDNYAAGGVSVGITEDGKLKKYAFNKKGERFEKHPVSGIVFENYEIPCYTEAVKMVQETHPTVAHFRSVSWDIAIDENGKAVLIEANFCRGGIDLLQLCNGPLFGDDTKKILDEVFKNRK